MYTFYDLIVIVKLLYLIFKVFLTILYDVIPPIQMTFDGYIDTCILTRLKLFHNEITVKRAF